MRRFAAGLAVAVLVVLMAGGANALGAWVFPERASRPVETHVDVWSGRVYTGPAATGKQNP